MSQITHSKLAAPLLARPLRAVAAGASLVAIAAGGLALGLPDRDAGSVSVQAQPSLREKTAGHHVSAILRKLAVRNRAEAVAAAGGLGLGPAGQAPSAAR